MVVNGGLVSAVIILVTAIVLFWIIGEEVMVDNRYDGRKPEPPYECTSCATLREELERVHAKHQDIEGIERAINESSFGLGTRMVARAVIAWLEEGK